MYARSLVGVIAVSTVLFAPAPATAQTCGTLQAWQAWELQNKPGIVDGDRHLRKAHRYARQGKNLRGIAKHLRAGAAQFLAVTSSPDAVTARQLHGAGRDFNAAARAIDALRAGAATSRMDAGWSHVDRANNAFAKCFEQLGSPAPG